MQDVTIVRGLSDYALSQLGRILGILEAWSIVENNAVYFELPYYDGPRSYNFKKEHYETAFIKARQECRQKLAEKAREKWGSQLPVILVESIKERLYYEQQGTHLDVGNTWIRSRVLRPCCELSMQAEVYTQPRN